MMKRTTLREIKSSLGRYLAILAIVALGVGFFSGVKITKEAMVNTLDEQLDKKEFFDYRVVLTTPGNEDIVKKYEESAEVVNAEGSVWLDVIVGGKGKDELVFSSYTITESINKLELISGRMPEKSDECVIDANQLNYKVGDVITISDNNELTTKGMYKHDTYTVVGTVNSPLYLNFERGSTKLLTGTVTGFVYFPKEAYAVNVYNEIYLQLDHDYDIYTDEYNDYLADKENLIKDLSPENSHILSRRKNVGYACFENDVDIVDNIAGVFPIFFFMVAALVCMTTMNRMVEEQRTQIGIFKALGYGNLTIMGKYVFYAGSAASIGAVGGYFIGTFIFPYTIWQAYKIMYAFNCEITYLFNVELAVISLIVSLICSIGAAISSCYKELYCVPAELIRPKSPKNGKRIFLERITFIWKRLKFLYKVSIRNVFRYKKRFFMMIVGISGCTSLLVAAFGLKDSISTLVDKQYNHVQLFDVQTTFAINVDENIEKMFADKIKDISTNYTITHEESVTVTENDVTKTLNMVVFRDLDDIEDFLLMTDVDGNRINCATVGEAVLTKKVANKLGVEVGDTITLCDNDYNEVKVVVGGIMKNHIFDYIYMSDETYEAIYGKSPEFTSAYVNLVESDKYDEKNAFICELPFVISSTSNRTFADRFANMIVSIDYIVLLVLISAALLAFVVLYNLTNINITERIREIATIKVLGFYPNETATYVFRENFVLAFLGALVGLVLGKFLHAFIMYSIDVAVVDFDVFIANISYLKSFGLTILFAFLVTFAMFSKLKKINMAESLKSIE